MTVVLMQWRLTYPVRAGMIGASLFALPIVMLGYDAHVVPLVLAAFVAGAGMEVFSIGWQTAYHEHIPNEYLSRVTSYDALGSSSPSRSARWRSDRWQTRSGSATSSSRPASRSARSACWHCSRARCATSRAQPRRARKNPAETAAPVRVKSRRDRRTDLSHADRSPPGRQATDRADPPRRHLRRRLRVAARQGGRRHPRRTWSPRTRTPTTR